MEMSGRFVVCAGGIRLFRAGFSIDGAPLTGLDWGSFEDAAKLG
jgi:hypothetical protein